MGGRGGMMDPRYQAMLYGGQGFGGFGDERKRRRPASLLLDESPLKVTLRVNSLKVVAKEKDESDAFKAMAQNIEAAKVKDEEGESSESDYPDKDEDGVDEFDEALLGPDGNPIGDDDDPNVTPTQAQIEAGISPPE